MLLFAVKGNLLLHDGVKLDVHATVSKRLKKNFTNTSGLTKMYK